jgi:hypothetical protein
MILFTGELCSPFVVSHSTPMRKFKGCLTDGGNVLRKRLYQFSALCLVVAGLNFGLYWTLNSEGNLIGTVSFLILTPVLAFSAYRLPKQYG